MNYHDLCHAIRDRSAGERLPGQISRAMMAIARGTTPVTAVRHPLGFLCLPLARRPGHGICVHIWTPQPAEAELTTSPMHSHSWDLLSYVLYGEVRNQLVNVSEAPPVPSHRVFEVHSSGDSDEIRRTARVVGCARGPGHSAGAGESYQLAADEFHMTEVSEHAATLLLARTRPGVLDLSLGGLDTPTHRVARQRCGPRETRLAAHALADRMNQTSTRSG